MSLGGETDRPLTATTDLQTFTNTAMSQMRKNAEKTARAVQEERDELSLDLEDEAPHNQ